MGIDAQQVAIGIAWYGYHSHALVMRRHPERALITTAPTSRQMYMTFHANQLLEVRHFVVSSAPPGDGAGEGGAQPRAHHHVIRRDGHVKLAGVAQHLRAMSQTSTVEALDWQRR